MAIKRIPCGGFFYDDESIEFDGRVIKAIGGGSGAMVVTATISVDEGEVSVAVDKSILEILEASKSMPVLCNISTESGATILSCSLMQASHQGVGVGVAFGIARVHPDTLQLGYALSGMYEDGLDTWTTALV